MDRCPNCGSTVRVGAKFCTTCGFRLPIPAAPQEPLAPARSPFDITSSAASGWPSYSTPTAAASPDETATAEPVAAPAEHEPPPSQVDEQAVPFSGWPSYGSGFGAHANWPGMTQSPADTFEAVADANTSAQKGEAIDFEALYVPQQQLQTAGPSGDNGSGAIDLQALARAEEPEFDELASFFDRGGNRSEERIDEAAVAAGDVAEPAAGASSNVAAGAQWVSAPSGTQAAAEGEKGTADSVDRYLERINAGAARESVADYLARVGETDQHAQEGDDIAESMAAPEPAAGGDLAGSPALADSDATGGEAAAADVDILARYAQDEEVEAQPAQAGAAADAAGQAPAGDDAEFANIFDRIFEGDETAVAAGTEPATSESDETIVTATESSEPAASSTSNEPELAEAATASEVEAISDETEKLETLASAEPARESSATAETSGDAHSNGDAAAEQTATVDEPAVRAAALVAELQALIPQLTNARGTPAVDVAAIADDLAEQRGVTIESDELQALRTTIATAQARPRDVDVMLDLVAKSATIADLLAAHDRFARAIDDAIAALRGETPPTPKPRW